MTLRSDPYEDFLNERVFSGLDRLRAFAEERGADMASISLAWLMANPRVTAPILGPRRPEQLGPGLRALEIVLTEEERRAIAGFFEA